MKRYLKNRLVGILVLAMLTAAMSMDVMAGSNSVVDLGTFRIAMESRNPGAREDPGEKPDPGKGGDEEILPDPEQKTEAASTDGIAQAPEGSDIITEPKTVVATKTKWRLTPSFNVARVNSSDKRAIKVSKKKDKARSSKGNKWYCGFIRVKKPGTVTVTLEGGNGEREEYLIYAEEPKIRKSALVVNDVKTISMDTYLSGIRYLKPSAITSKKTAVATVSADGSITVKSDGRSKITLSFGKRKIKGNVKAKLPAFKKKKVEIKDKPVQLQMKNVSDNSAVRYSSSNISVVKMNKDGYAAPVANGTATVFGKSGNVTAECEVTVKGLR